MQGRARGKDRTAHGRTEGGIIADGQRTFVNLGDAGVSRSTREAEDAGTVLIQGKCPVRPVIQGTREGGIRQGVSGDDRTTGEEASVRDDPARTRQRADGGVANPR